MSHPSSSEQCEREFRRVQSVLDDLTSRDRNALQSNGIEIIDFSDRGGRESPPCWSMQFRKKWPIQFEFGLVTLDVSYTMAESVSSPEPIRVRRRAEVFQSGGTSRFDHTEETNISLDELRNIGVIALVHGAIANGSGRIQALMSSPEGR